MQYVRSLSKFSQSVVLATSSDSLVSGEFALHLGNLASRFIIEDMGKLRRQLDGVYFRSVVSSIRVLGAKYPDYTPVVPEGDKLMPRVALARRIPKSTFLIMRAPNILRRGSRLIDAIKLVSMWIVRARGHRIVVLLPADLVRGSYAWGSFHATPDPVDVSVTKESIEAVRRDLGLGNNVNWFGVFGNISARKNLPMIAEAISLLPKSGSGLLIAGKIEASQLAAAEKYFARIRAGGGQVVVVDRLLGDEELDCAIAAVDAVVLAHSSDGPSGILGKAAQLGTAVLASGAAALRSDVDRLGCGGWSSLDTKSLLLLMSEFLAGGVPRQKRDLATESQFVRGLLG